MNSLIGTSDNFTGRYGASIYLTNLFEINGLENKNKVKNDKNKREFLSLINLDFLKIIKMTNKVSKKIKEKLLKELFYVNIS